MAYTFNGVARTISFTGGALSVREMWSRYMDWLAESDNSKHLPMLRTVGMDTPDIPFYLFLEMGVTLVVTNTSLPTVVGDGVLKTDDSRDPFGGAVVNVRYEAPGIAIGYSTTASAVAPVVFNAPSAPDIAAMVLAVLQANPLPVDLRSIKGQTIIGDGVGASPWRPQL